jgi:DNA-binding GntR family transcriptional regulator
MERERIFGLIRRDILACDLMPGSELREAELARRYGVSKTPVRDAMQRLESEGLIETEPRRGHRVRPISMQDAEDLIEVRSILESAAVAKVAKVASDTELRGLDALRRPEADGVDAFAEYNRRFHVSLADLSRNRRLAEEIKRMMEFYDRLALVSLASLSRTVGLEVPLADHCAIIDALQARNGRLAARLVRQHVARSRTAIMKGLGRQPIVP